MPSDPTEREWLEGIGERFEREHEERRSDPVTLNDLRVHIVADPNWETDTWLDRITDPATLDDVTQLLSGLPPDQLVQVLEGMGAKRDATAFRQLGTEGLFGWRVEVDGPGSYLVLPLPTPQSDQ